MILKTLKFKVYHNDKYLDKYDKWLGICRYTYNLAMETKETAFKAGVSLSNYDLQKQFTSCKQEAPWLKEVHSNTLLSVFDRLDLAYSKYFKELKNGTISKLKSKYLLNKKSKDLKINWKTYNNIGKPKWAKKNEYNTLNFKSIQQENKGFKLPKFGNVKVFNLNLINKYKILKYRTATLTKYCGDLYLNVVVEVESLKSEKLKNENQVVGIDLGIVHFAYLSNGQAIPNHKHLSKYINQLKLEQVKLSNRYDKNKKEQSKSYLKQKLKVARIHKKVKNTRIDFLQKLTTELANNYDTIAIENLDILNMVSNSFLAQHIYDCSWGLFVQLLKSKVKNLIKVNPAYTSQTCYKCGNIDSNNRKSQSKFECTACGHVDSADKNASKNILGRALSK